MTLNELEHEIVVGQEETYYFNAKPDQGFNFGYFLYVPKNIRNGAPLVVGGNNSPASYRDYGQPIDKVYKKHKELTETELNNKMIIPYFTQLGVPALMPVIPRIETSPNMEIYTQQLSRNTMLIGKEGFQVPGVSEQDLKKLERLDLQLIGMINDAKARLELKDILLDEKVIMFGFSTSAVFVERFTLLHPEKVKAICAGGIGACMSLPLAEYKGEILPYPIGVHDFEEITGKKFSEEEYRKVKRFYFVGSDEDDGKYRNGYKQNYNIIFNPMLYEASYGQKMARVLGETIAERWENLIKIYKEFGFHDIAKNCKLYPGVHEIVPAFEDIIRFIDGNIEKKPMNKIEHTGKGCEGEKVQSARATDEAQKRILDGERKRKDTDGYERN